MRRFARLLMVSLIGATTLQASVLQAETISTKDLRDPPLSQRLLDPAAQISLLKEINSAAQSLPFHGTYVHHLPQGMYALRLHQAPTSQGLVTRLESLEGQAREVVRTQRSVRAYLPDQKLVRVSQPVPGRPDFPLLYVGDPAALLGHYQMLMLPGKRIAGYETDLVEFRSIDRLRWSVRCWIEKRRRLLLKMQQLSETGSVLEEHVFTELRIGPVAQPVLRSPFDGQSGWREQQGGMQPVAPKLSDVAALPMGFLPIAQLRSTDGRLTQWVVSDGLATVSIFLEKRAAAGQELADGQRGGMSFAGRQRDDWLVTAMGEVPLETAAALASRFPLVQ